ncbi:hypothetical protein HYH03_010761 [Edaphochlamys debaryana]|uniref:BTB domain-containing protein n=1 Tax=Edaphochlamys debaryana TaxID=47281 RepID=A0A836BX53_9CHLO|nr:hypothetical protein HYH03_010761 [Edaphochlamys debaryana]|eukprot:KAG2490843.1 hypothetical protein HYH03_010761 [Edaphochlamys debaryana]
MARTKQTARKNTGGRRRAPPRSGPIAYPNPDPADLLQNQPKSYEHVSRPTGFVTRYVAEPVSCNVDSDSDADPEADAGPSNVETLLLDSSGHMHALPGAATRGPFWVGSHKGRVSYSSPGGASDVSTTSPTYDPYSGFVYLLEGCSVVRMGEGGDFRLTTVAGRRTSAPPVDGRGSDARFQRPTLLTNDGDGNLYVADEDRIRCVAVPAAARAARSGVSRTQLSAAGGGGGGAAAAAAAAGEAQVSTLPFRAAAPITGLACVPASSATGGGGLAFSTATAVYWLPRPRGNSAAAGPSAPALATAAAAAAASTSAAARPLRLAGVEGQALGADDDEEAERQILEPTPGPETRFTEIVGLTADGRGGLVLTMTGPSGGCWVRRVSVPDGTTSTLATNLSGTYTRPAVLPNGYFVACDTSDVCVIDLALTPPPCCPPGWSGLATRAAAASTQLCADLGALLDRQPDGTADLSLVVGGRTFHAHRSILTARSKYFSSRLAGDFVEGRARVLDLPDADPDALALALKWVYTGAVDVPPGKVQAVVELADRLELLQLGEELQKRVLAGVDAETVVDALLWADALQLHPLRGALLSWLLEFQRAVMDRAAGSVKRLMVANPGLMFEVQLATLKRGEAAAAR